MNTLKNDNNCQNATKSVYFWLFMSTERYRKLFNISYLKKI
jgi:hypothetical protein